LAEWSTRKGQATSALCRGLVFVPSGSLFDILASFSFERDRDHRRRIVGER